VEIESEGGALSRKLARSDSKLSRSRSYGSIWSTGTAAGRLLLVVVVLEYGGPGVGEEGGCIARKAIRGSRRESGPRWMGRSRAHTPKSWAEIRVMGLVESGSSKLKTWCAKNWATAMVMPGKRCMKKATGCSR